MNMIIEDKYELLEKIGEGTFGKIFRGKNKITEEFVAIKIEKDKNKGSILLKNEARIYQSVLGIFGVPSMRSYGMEGKYSYLVMDLLGQTLEDIKVKQGGRLPLRMTILLGLQMLKRVEDLHKKHIVHRDIKPANFVFGIDNKKSILHMVDFGLGRYYKDTDDVHTVLETGRKLTGTARFVSLNVHDGLTPSRRDDIESIGYILMYLLNGYLPWQDVTGVDKKDQDRNIGENKRKTCFWTVYQNIPGEFVTFILYCRKLSYDAEPNYEYLSCLLKNLHRLDDNLFGASK